MKLRTQFIITMFLFGIILAVMAVSAIITNQQVRKASEQERIASIIAQGATELSYLSNDYLIYRESQQLKRWQSRFASFSAQVASLRADRPDQQALVANIRANQNRLKEVFDSVASAPAAPSRNQKLALDPALLQVSWSRVAVQTQGLVSDASRLSQLLHQRIDELRNTRTMLIYFMVGLLGVFLLASYMLTYRRILRSLATLQAGAAVIGSGNLNFIIEEKKNDEIGDLSQAFNRMTADLKTVTASKADLEREIVERKRAEEDLRQQREWLRVTLNSIGDAVIATDTQGRITFLNPVAVTLTGWQSGEALGQPVQSVFRIINEKTHTPAEDLVARVLNEKRVVGLANDTALLTKDGREIPIEDSAAPILDATGNVTGVVLVFHDVTQKRRAQATLRKSEARYRSYIEVTEQLGWTTNAEGEVTEDIPAWRKFTGQNEEQVKGWGWSKALHPEDFEHTARVWRNAVATKSRYETEYRIRRHDGVFRHFLALGVPVLKENGDIQEWVGTCIDITERKRAEEALRQRTLELEQLTETLEQRVQERTEELTNANEALRYLSSKLLSAQEDERKRVAGELHDTIGSCLSGIKFKVENSLQQMGKTQNHMTESLKTIIPVIQEGIEDCRRMQLDLRPSMLDDLGLLPTLSWFCRRYQTIYTRIKVELEQTLEEGDIPNSLKIVIYRVTQEGMNNIAKHSKADLVHLFLREMDGRIGLVLEDNGQGFDLKKVLGSESTKRGLGLTSMRERTELSGGSFTIESAEGKGTIIRASWPL
jgi:PAS domain S-box-containing protein